MTDHDEDPIEDHAEPGDQSDTDTLFQGLLALSRGELEHRLPRTGRRDTADATAFLFNAMADQLQDLITSLNTERARLQEGVEQFSEVLSRMAAADFEARAVRSYDGSPLDVLGFLVNATAEELGALYQELRDTNDRLERQAHSTVNERLAATNTLAAGVGHELRNPLGVAAGNLEYLADELPNLLGSAKFDTRLRQVVEDSRVAVATAATIATELALLRPNAEPKQEPVPLDSVVATSIRMVRNVADHRAHLEVTGDPSAMAYVDKARLGQVVVNLVHNAALAMPRDRPVVENLIRIWSGPISPDEVAIEVADNGVGMPPDVVNRVFEAFFTTRAVGEGTGLGLAICQRLITDQGGHIDLTSESGVGSTFRVVLPRAIAPDPGAESDDTAELSTDDLLDAVAPLRMLLIDDEPLFHTVVQHMVGERVDYTSTTSGLVGLQLARAGGFDVVLSDLMLPDMGGQEIYESLRAEGSPMVERFAFITGGSFTPEAQRFLESVDAPVLGKPFNRREILTTVLKVAHQEGPHS